MTIANDEYYAITESKEPIKWNFSSIELHIAENTIIRDIGIEINVHGQTFKTVYIWQHGVVYMANEFKTGSSMRSFEIVDAISSDGDFATVTKNDSFHIIWYNLKICKLHPETLVDLQMSFHRDGIVQIELVHVLNRPKNCDLTMKISEGTCQMYSKRRGKMLRKRGIKTSKYPAFSLRIGHMIEFTPSSGIFSANNEYYLFSEGINFKEWKFIKYIYRELHPSMIRDIGMVINVHGQTFKSAYISRSGVVYMANEFKTGSSMRSFEIVAATSRDGDFATATKNDTLFIKWYNLRICELHPETIVYMEMQIQKRGIVVYHLNSVYDKPKNCNLTMKISDGTCQMNRDGSVTMLVKKVLTTVIYPVSRIFDGLEFKFTPRSANVTM